MKIDKQDEERMQEDVFAFIEEIKEFISSDVWNSILLNCTKNEVLVFWLLYRKSRVNMTEIAEYIHAPLNTATGIINKLEKNGFVTRERLKEDKRVVVIALTKQGMAQVEALVDTFTYYARQIIMEFSQEELDIFFRMAKRFLEILKKEREHKEDKSKIRRIPIE
ncbi:MAG: MarR family transcriptional regulator [Lachnospiraceae bacterium]|nr:MarR family transcriptional regulator [Lachnospiraceae bacterium]MEE1009244.1 MarR family transcriptional regulator [Agathobacter sp.]